MDAILSWLQRNKVCACVFVCGSYTAIMPWTWKRPSHRNLHYYGGAYLLPEYWHTENESISTAQKTEPSVQRPLIANKATSGNTDTLPADICLCFCGLFVRPNWHSLQLLCARAITLFHYHSHCSYIASYVDFMIKVWHVHGGDIERRQTYDLALELVHRRKEQCSLLPAQWHNCWGTHNQCNSI